MAKKDTYLALLRRGVDEVTAQTLADAGVTIGGLKNMNSEQLAIVGEDALNERDLQMLKFADIFEDKFLRQGRDEERTIFETLDLSWELLTNVNTKYLVRLDQKWIDKYHPTEKKE